MNINIRKSTKDDWQIIQKLNAEVYENSFQFDPYLIQDDCYTKESEEDYKQAVINTNKFCMIAEIEGVPVGYLVGGKNNYAYRSNKRGEIFHMGTSPNFRSHGIGTLLVNEFKKWCKNKGLSHIAVSAYFNDPKARAFYEKRVSSNRHHIRRRDKIMNINVVENPDYKELHNLFERSFSEILHDDTGYFEAELNQDKLSDWFDFDEMIKYLPIGKLVEARDEENKLIGAGFIAKQNPISWPDGHKAELFIIGILPGTQNNGFGSTILEECEKQAKLFGAETVIVNAHSMQPQPHKFYEKNGYKKMGELVDYYANGNAVFFSKIL